MLLFDFSGLLLCLVKRRTMHTLRGSGKACGLIMKLLLRSIKKGECQRPRCLDTTKRKKEGRKEKEWGAFER